MVQRSPDLPDFAIPPVVEVLLGVQFDTLPGFRSVHSGSLWSVFRKEFPEFQEKAPLSPAFETFGTKPSPQNIHLQFHAGAPPVPRYWFVNSEKTELVQFQPDRFVHNWRKVNTGESYPRYERIKLRFMKELAQLVVFSQDKGLGEVRPNQCEVTYVNQILSIDDENLKIRPDMVFTFVRSFLGTKSILELEDVGFNLRFVMRSDSGEPIGRLRVSAQPGEHQSGASMIILTLTTTGAPSEPSMVAVSHFLDHGRKQIVKTFAELTTDLMHKRWGRIQ